MAVADLVGFVGFERRARSAADKPNVLFVLCDDLRPDALSCFGSKHVKTPHIDRLANEGVRFANSFCTTSLCSPSRASILTGLYAHRHGVRDNFTELPANLPHWPGRLQASGYRTAYIGKWHMAKITMRPDQVSIGLSLTKDKASISILNGTCTEAVPK